MQHLLCPETKLRGQCQPPGRSCFLPKSSLGSLTFAQISSSAGSSKHQMTLQADDPRGALWSVCFASTSIVTGHDNHERQVHSFGRNFSLKWWSSTTKHSVSWIFSLRMWWCQSLQVQSHRWVRRASLVLISNFCLLHSSTLLDVTCHWGNRMQQPNTPSHGIF